MNKGNIVLKDFLVQFVLQGKRNEDLPLEVRQGRDKHSVNETMNKVRKWFQENNRAKEYAQYLIRLATFEEAMIQDKFNAFCRLSKPLQITALKFALDQNPRKTKMKRTEKEEIKEKVAV